MQKVAQNIDGDIYKEFSYFLGFFEYNKYTHIYIL